MTHSFTKGVPIDTDGTLSLNSNQVVPSQAAVVTYVTNAIAAQTDLHTAKLIVNPSGGSAGGNYTTITSALAAASSGDTIFITPGTYTEDLTLKAGVNLCAYDCDALTPNVIILGKMTATFAGTASLSGLQLKTASDYFLVVSGTAVTNINLKNCYLNCNVGRGINHTTTGASATLNIIDCKGDTPTAGASGTFWTEANSTTKIINVINTHISNSGGAIGYRTSSGTLNVINSSFNHACDCVSDAVVTLTNSTYNCSSLNSQAYTFNSSGAQIAYNCIFLSGTASAVGGSAAFSLFGCNISSSNTNAITGGGTVTYAGLIFSGTSSTINTTTQIGDYMHLGKWRATSQPAFLATANLQSNVTGDGTSYTIIFANEIFDQNNNFDGTSTFTAPVKGRYQFNVTIEFADLGAANTSGSINIVATSRTVQIAGCNWGNLRNVANAARASGSVLLDMEAGNTCTVTTAISGGTKIVDVVATNSAFSGFLVA